MALPLPILLLLPFALGQAPVAPDPYRNPALENAPQRFSPLPLRIQDFQSRDPDRPLVEGAEDVGPLRTSLRVLQPIAREDADFESVYVVPQRADLLMRRSGGVTVVFRRSRYLQTRDGVVAVMPAGAVFFIGEPAPEALAAHFPPPAGPMGADGSAPAVPSARSPAGPTRAATFLPAARAGEARPGAPRTRPADANRHVQPEGKAASPPPRPTVWTSELYRRQRLAEILQHPARKSGRRLPKTPSAR